MTTNDKTPDPTTAILSAERLAEIRAADAADTWPVASTVGGHDRRALLAHLDALTGPLPADGGEALGAATYAEFESAEKHNFPLCRTKTYEPWESMPARMRDVYRRIAIALYQRGFAAGRSEGEAERARLRAQLDRLHLEYEANERDRQTRIAEINGLRREVASECALTAELRAMEAEALASADRWKAASEKHERERDAMAAELAEARGATEHARMDVKLTSALQEMAEHDASVARRDGAREERRRLLDQLSFFVKVHTETEDERGRGEGQGS